MRIRNLLTITISLLLVVTLTGLTGLTSHADAQRRRRPRPAPPPENTQPEDGGVDVVEDENAQVTPGEGDPTLPPGQAMEGEGGEAGAGAPTSTPEPVETEHEDPLEEPLGPDLAPIRQEFTSIMDELVQVRSRVAVLGRQLFRTRMRVEVQNRAGERQSLARLVLRLDGAPIYQGEGGEVPEDGRQVFDGFAAPGPHVLSIELEQRSRADAEFRYTLRDTYRFQVVRERLTEVVLILDDDSNIAEDFEDGGEGKFEVKTRLRVATRALGDQ